MFIFSATPAGIVEAQSPGDIIPNNYIVVLKDDQNTDQVADDATKNTGIKVKQKYHNKIKGYAAVISPDKLDKIKKDKRVKLVVPDRVVRVADTGDGLKGDYFDNIDFTSLKLTRIDPTVNFNWAGGSPDPLIGAETFTVRWSGQVLAPQTATYTFYTKTDDGVRLWVNNQLLVDHWVNQGTTEWKGNINLTAGQKYNIKMEYFENGGGATSKLSWSTPTLGIQIIPTANLYSTAAPSPTPVPTPSPTPVPIVYTTSATVAPASLFAGNNFTVNSSVKISQAKNVLVDIEVYNPSGVKAFQSTVDNQSFTAGQTKTYSTPFTSAITNPAGVYTVKIGIFGPAFNGLLNWNDNAASVTLVAPTPTPSPTPTPTPVPSPSPSAVFINQDLTTKGNWKGKYGSDGYSLEADGQKIPGYTTLNISNTQIFTWAASTSDVRGLQKVASPTDRIAATWFNNVPFTFDVNPTDGQNHKVSLYSVDWSNSGRAQTVTVINAASGATLDTRSESSFYGGSYLSWLIRGHVKFSINQTAGPNADVSAIFFDPPAGAPSPTPAPTATPSPSPSPTPNSQITPTGVLRIGPNGTNTGLGVTVAVIDTGIDMSHPDLAGEIVASYNCVNPGQPATDGYGHGTHVAGIIAAQNNNFGVVGVAPGAKLANVKVMDDNGTGSWSSVICGLDWVSQNAATYNIKVANVSLAGGGSSDNQCGQTDGDVLHTAFCNSTQAGVTYVVAAGNSGVDVATMAPAAYYDTLISVSALADADGQPGGLGGQIAGVTDDNFLSYSDYGATVDFAAPGANILSSYKGGGYVYMSGTSMASPHVAGAAALYIATHPGSTWTQVKNGLKAVAEPLNQGHTDPTGLHFEPVVKTSSL